MVKKNADNVMKMFWCVLLSGGFFFSPAIGYSEPLVKLKAVATNSMVANWIKNIAGDQVVLTTLVGANADVHTFEPTPSDNVALAKADIIFEIGLGFEHWMNRLYAASASRAKRIVLTDQVVSQPLTILRLGQKHGEDVDPHVWHNVRYVMGMVKRMGSALASADPAHAAIYKANTISYLKQLEALEAWAIRKVAEVPRERRKLVTNHDSLGYLCQHYGFDLIGAAFESATTEAEDPSARDIAHLIDKIKTSGVPVVFAENIHNSQLLASIAREAHVQLAPPLYTDALGSQPSQADTYIKMMRYNIETIVRMLQ
ncbi:MAG: zinc ABC transporter substrate-binding protein [Candidatus Omnitrophica bacterium]|nr:zinc ABC transporter substrate-binding protein [Candidatus Omnitrophota bacterium]